MKTFFSDGWEVLIKGCPHDLRQLARESSGRFFSIYGGIDHWNDCPNQDFRLSSCLFDGLNNIDDLYAIAAELIRLFSGATRLVEYETSFTYEVAGIELNNVGQHFSRDGRVRVPDNNKEPIIPDNESFFKYMAVDVRYGLVELAFNNQDVWAILQYLSTPPTLDSLSKILDSIKGYSCLKNTPFKVDTDSDEYTAFGNTANNFSISILNARHGYKYIKNPKENKTDTMSIATATNYVVGQAKLYLLSAYPILKSGRKFSL